MSFSLPRWTLSSASSFKISYAFLHPRRIFSTKTSARRNRLRTVLELCSDQDLQRIYAFANSMETVSPILKPGKKKVPSVRTEAEFGSNVKLRPCEPTPHGMGCFAARSFKKGEVIIPIRGKITEESTFESLHIDEGRHIHMKKPEVFLNHHCDPNGYIDFKTLEYRALRDIEEDEQLFWNFHSTEWDLERPFNCPCGREMTGFKHLETVDQLQLKPFLSPYMESLLLADKKNHAE